MKNQNTPRHYLFGISGWLSLRSAFLLVSTAAALLGAPLATQGAPVNFVITGSLAMARTEHTETLLPSGKVLVAGGNDDTGFLASAELYDPASGSWSTTGSLATARSGHTATLLPDGRVLVAGGFGTSGLSGAVAVAYAQVYDTARLDSTLPLPHIANRARVL